MCVYICVYVYMCMCICVYVYVRMYLCTYVHMYICIYVYMYICMYVCICICICICMCMCICTCICIHTCTRTNSKEHQNRATTSAVHMMCSFMRRSSAYARLHVWSLSSAKPSFVGYRRNTYEKIVFAWATKQSVCEHCL